MHDYSMVIVLCEDRQHEVFMRTFLVNRGVSPHRIRVRLTPGGRGAGEQYVHRQYPGEVKIYRSKRRRLNIALATMIDADTKSVTDRLEELDLSLKTAQMERRREDEQIGIFVPKRNIETWIHYLMGHNVDETTAYPPFKKKGECKPYVKRLAEGCRQTLDPKAPPSLHAGCIELQRIP